MLRNVGLWNLVNGIISQLWLPLQHVPIFTFWVAKPLCPVASVAITTSVVVFESLPSSSLSSLNSVTGTSLSRAAPPKNAVKSTLLNLKFPFSSAVSEKSAPVLQKDLEATLSRHFASRSISGMFWSSSTENTGKGSTFVSKVRLKELKGVLSTYK